MAKAKEYEFPLLNDTEIVTELSEILPPQSATELSINDLKKPTASKWQKFYIDIFTLRPFSIWLGLGLGLRFSFERGKKQLEIGFKTISAIGQKSYNDIIWP